MRVAETGSFTAAAKRLRVPKSTISRRIARLETDLDTALVVRTSRRVTLSEAGAVYLERIVPALAKIDEASREAREERERPRGHLRVTAPFDIASGWLASILPVFRERCPEVTLEIIVDDRRLDLVAEGIDVALRAARQLEDSTLVARRLATMTISLWASRSYLRKRGKPRTPEDLAHHDVLYLRGAQGRSRLVLHGEDGERAVDVNVPLSSNDMVFLRRMADAGQGIAAIPSVLSMRSELEHVLPGWTLAESALFAVYPSARLVPAKVRVFRDYLVEMAPTLEQGSDPERSRARRKP